MKLGGKQLLQPPFSEFLVCSNFSMGLLLTSDAIETFEGTQKQTKKGILNTMNIKLIPSRYLHALSRKSMLALADVSLFLGWHG